jgi:hypothetical protein
MPSPFDKFVDKFKSGTKVAAEQMKLAGRITALNVERTTQKTERDRLLKEIGMKTYSVFSKKKELAHEPLMEEIMNELHHLERIDQRLEEIEAEIAQLRAEYVARNDGKEPVADTDASVEESESDSPKGSEEEST